MPKLWDVFNGESYEFVLPVRKKRKQEESKRKKKKQKDSKKAGTETLFEETPTRPRDPSEIAKRLLLVWYADHEFRKIGTSLYSIY